MITLIIVYNNNIIFRNIIIQCAIIIITKMIRIYVAMITILEYYNNVVNINDKQS